MEWLRQFSDPRWRSAAIFLCLGLAGCFDAVAKLSLNPDGSGKLHFRAAFTREASDLIIAGQAAQPPPAIDNENENTLRNFVLKDGQLIQEESLAFKTLSDVVMTGDHIEVVDLGRTSMGARRNRVTWILKSGARSEGDEGTMQFAALFFTGHTVELSMELPCTIESAANVDMGNFAIAPTLGSAPADGGTVTWQVPLVAVMAVPAGRSVAFSAECTSRQGIMASATRSAARATAKDDPGLGQTSPGDAEAPTAVPVDAGNDALPTRKADVACLSLPDPARFSGAYSAELAKVGKYTFPLIGQRVRDDGYALPGSEKFNNACEDWKWTCKASVYAMIARGVGYTDAKIDEFWNYEGRAFWNGEAVRDKTGVAVTFEPDPPIDENAEPIGNFSEVVHALQAGQPVMIHGTVDGNPYGHWMLATAVTPAGVIANDPWEKRQITIDLTARKIIDPPDHELKSFEADAYIVVTITPLSSASGSN